MLNVKVDFVGYLWSLSGLYRLGAEESDDRHENENGRDLPKHDGRKERNIDVTKRWTWRN
jgi:hypothetical protein